VSRTDGFTVSIVPGEDARRCREVREYRAIAAGLLMLAGDRRGHGVALVAMGNQRLPAAAVYLLAAEAFTRLAHFTVTEPPVGRASAGARTARR
jgi:hypothetical protein